MASIALPRSETRPASGIMSWLTTVDHKKIGRASCRERV